MKLNTCIKSLTPYLMVVVFLGLQACGSGGGTTVVKDANPAGYYTGTATVKDADNITDLPDITDIQIMISGSRIMIMSDSKALLYDGTYTVSGNDLTSTLSVYSDGKLLAGADGTATLNATITEGSQLTGNFVGTKFGNGSFVSTYSNLSNTSADLSNLHEAVITGTNSHWRTDGINLEGVRNEFKILNTSGAIGADSNFSNSYFLDCLLRTTTADPYFPSTFSLLSNASFYAVSINYISCSANGGDANSTVTGTYSGFAQFKVGTPNVIEFAISNGTYSIADEMFYIP